MSEQAGSPHSERAARLAARGRVQAGVRRKDWAGAAGWAWCREWVVRGHVLWVRMRSKVGQHAAAGAGSHAQAGTWFVVWAELSAGGVGAVLSNACQH
jgi:hypothetical protein